jgi:trimethylguanosine synthase
VIAMDTSPVRLALARHNASVYGVADRIEFVLGDYIQFARSYATRGSSSSRSAPVTRKIDVVFLSPPWGGPSYLAGSPTKSKPDLVQTPDAVAEDEGHPTYSLSSIQPIPGAELFRLTRQITRNVAYFLPRNTSLEEVGALLRSDEQEGDGGTSTSLEEKVEIEEEWMGSKLKALTCYFGGLVGGQEDLF